MMLIDIEPILDAAKLAGKEYVSIDFLKGFEQVDAMPVVRGEWEFVNDYESKCTACNKNEVVDHAEEPKYCPNCGAKMEGKQ
jgi:hypothetical protein